MPVKSSLQVGVWEKTKQSREVLDSSVITSALHNIHNIYIFNSRPKNYLLPQSFALLGLPSYHLLFCFCFFIFVSNSVEPILMNQILFDFMNSNVTDTTDLTKPPPPFTVSPSLVSPSFASGQPLFSKK